jgi:hypothetical protein
MIDDIKFANTLEDVQEIRKRQVEAERAGGDHDGIQRILTEDMYSNPLRFIDELLQNAQDAARKAAKITGVEFRLYNDKLEFFHSGKDFDLKDVIGITGIGASTKSDQDIGTFGIGFKSVYQITDEPHIHSGKYDFKIVEFRIPISVPKNKNIQNTAIILPLKKEFEQGKIFFYLNDIETESLLFLPNIDSITWYRHEEGQQKTCLSKIPLDEHEDENLNYKKIEIRNISSEKSKQYLVFQRSIQISGKNLDIEIAFGFDPVNNRIIPLKNRKLHVFFPTTEETHLNILLNAPFRTTANRENIKLENDDDNRMLEELSRLTSDSILFIKKQFPDLLDVNFYSYIIPLKGEEQNHIYKVFFGTIKALLKNPKNTLLPVQNSDFASANDVLLAENSSLMELLNVTDNKKLFGKTYWVNNEITASKERTKDLHSYLKEHLDVEDIGFEKFAKLFTEIFIEKKNDQWIRELYRTLLTNQKRLWEKNPWELSSWDNQTDGIWKKKPIIRLNNGKHIAPYDEHGNPQAWLSSESKSYFDTVKSTLIEDKEAKEFLVKIGLEKPDLLAEFKNYIAPSYKDESPSVEIEKYLQDISMAFATYREYRNRPDKRDELVNTIKSLYFIKARNAGTGYKLFKKPDQVYVPAKEKELEMWFHGNEHAYFVDEKILHYFTNERREFEEFFSAIGVSNEVKFIEPLRFDKKKYYCEDNHKYGKFEPKDFKPDFDIDGLSYSLDNISIERSKVIWKIALIKSTHIATCKVRSARFQRCLDGDYNARIPSERPKEKMIESIAGKLLKERHWLYDRQGNLIRKPNSEIALEDLHDNYDRSDDNINKLVKALGLRPEIYTKDQVDEIVSQKDEKIKELERKLNKYEKAKVREKPQRDYVLAELQIRDVPEPTQILVNNKGDLEGLVNQKPGIGGDSENNVHKSNDDNEESDSNPDKKEYGRWAEEYVVKQLRGKYKDDGDIRIEWLNENAETGKGCDIIIKKNNEAISFIEVKGKVSSKPDFFEVSEMQLRFASDQGEKYFFYVVSNVKSKEIKIEMVIRDPIKEWRENRLIAAHIKFKI